MLKTHSISDLRMSIKARLCFPKITQKRNILQSKIACVNTPTEIHRHRFS